MQQKKLLAVIVLLFSPFSMIYSQVDYMINGGFETIDLSIPVMPPYPQGTAPIYLAPPWNNITNTCDVHNSDYQQTASIAGIPHTGEGNGRFVSPNGQNAHQSESCYGKTFPLTAGQTYVISFWIRQDFPSDHDVPVGVIISENIPSISYTPFFASQIAECFITPTNTQYINASFCFTAENSVEHFVTFAPWEDASGEEAVGFYIDDVSVEELPVGTVLPSADITIPQTIYCTNNSVVIDGSTSSNEDGYLWEVFNISNGYEQSVYSSSSATGQAGTLTLNTINIPVFPGDCYRVYLTVRGTCEDRKSIEFCYEDPNIDFLNGTNAICEGVPIDLSVTGDNNWIYNWSTGQSGEGLKTIQVTPTSGPTVNYSVTVTTVPLGCTNTANISFVVHSSDNQAPWMNGINGSGEYIIYVNQGNVVSFTSQLFNDNVNEEMTIDLTNNIASYPFPNIIPPSTANSYILSFQWNTGTGLFPNVPSGEYNFSIIANDQNACTFGIDTFTFIIVVVCDQCPICVSYEDRTPSTIPLPLETKAAKCIEAGISLPVSGGTDHIVFQAGQYIELGDFFDSGTDYEAIIEPTSCVTDCEDCCIDWPGFTVDEIPNGYYMNFEDSDPTNDIFQVTDIYHPFCAFGAKGYDLVITNAWGNVMGESSFSTSSCCPLESPAPENPITHSSIWWDGYTDNLFGNQVHPNDGVYYYLLTLYGCDGVSEEYQGFIHIFSSSGIVTAPATYEGMTADQITTITESIEEQNRLTLEIGLSPNPASDVVAITGIMIGTEYSAQLYDDKGLMIERDLKLKNNQFNVSGLSPGTYYCKLFIDGQFISKKFVKL